jgi:putative N-acetyltransferase (TIGR04045 family)
MMELAPSQFLCPGYYIREAATPWEARGVADLRHRVFVEEQAIFSGHDRDEIDLVAIHLAALSTYAHEADAVVGTVRIHQAKPRLWWGSRLAVDRDFRQVGRLGTELIRLAVRTAATHGCDTFLAHVQKQNEVLFRRLHWQSLEEVVLHGVLHVKMQADLAYYPALDNPAAGWYHPMRRGIAQ